MSGAAENKWFYMSHGHRQGPVSRESLSQLLTNKELMIESTHVWCEGMKDWEKVEDSKQFASTIRSIREAAMQAEADVRHAASVKGVGEDALCRGATRGLFNLFFYLGWLVPFLIGIAITSELQVHRILSPEYVSDSWWCQFLPFFLVMIYLWQIAASRMKHAGYPAWLGATVFIPIWNIWTLLVCLCAPQNFRRKKKLGKRALGCFLLFVVMLGIPFSAVIPGLNTSTLAPVEVKDRITHFYKYSTGMNARMKKNDEKSSQAESRRKRIEEQKKLDKSGEVRRKMAD